MKTISLDTKRQSVDSGSFLGSNDGNDEIQQSGYEGDEEGSLGDMNEDFKQLRKSGNKRSLGFAFRDEKEDEVHPKRSRSRKHRLRQNLNKAKFRTLLESERKHKQHRMGKGTKRFECEAALALGVFSRLLLEKSKIIEMRDAAARSRKYVEVSTSDEALEELEPKYVFSDAMYSLEEAMEISTRVRVLVEAGQPYRIVNVNAAYHKFRMACPKTRKLSMISPKHTAYADLATAVLKLFADQRVSVHPVCSSGQTTHYLLQLCCL